MTKFSQNRTIITEEDAILGQNTFLKFWCEKGRFWCEKGRQPPFWNKYWTIIGTILGLFWELSYFNLWGPILTYEDLF